MNGLVPLVEGEMTSWLLEMAREDMPLGRHQVSHWLYRALHWADKENDWRKGKIDKLLTYVNGGFLTEEDLEWAKDMRVPKAPDALT